MTATASRLERIANFFDARNESNNASFIREVASEIENLRTTAAEVNAGVGSARLPFDREQLGRFVREAWVRWAETQPNPKPSWLAPYDELSEPDKEADRQIGEALARWAMIGTAAQYAFAEPSRSGAADEARDRLLIHLGRLTAYIASQSGAGSSRSLNQLERAADDLDRALAAGVNAGAPRPSLRRSSDTSMAWRNLRPSKVSAKSPTRPIRKGWTAYRDRDGV